MHALVLRAPSHGDEGGDRRRGSGIIRPGAASLAHRGCLFLDEAPEFDRDVLDALRQPLESGEVVIARPTVDGMLSGPVHAGAGG